MPTVGKTSENATTRVGKPQQHEHGESVAAVEVKKKVNKKNKNKKKNPGRPHHEQQDLAAEGEERMMTLRGRRVPLTGKAKR